MEIKRVEKIQCIAGIDLTPPLPPHSKPHNYTITPVDCWDGPTEPIIYHGKTLTTKISFRSVIQEIAKKAFVATELVATATRSDLRPLPYYRLLTFTFRILCDCDRTQSLTHPDLKQSYLLTQRNRGNAHILVNPRPPIAEMPTSS